jgi:hypothetical protein
MAKTIYFQKEENQNVTIRTVSTNAVLYSLSPAQNLSKDIANSNTIIIKSAVSSFDDKGISIKYTDIDNLACSPVIVSPVKPAQPLTIDDFLTALSRDFFFEVGQQIKYVDSIDQLPSSGDIKTIYITLDTRKQYYWNGFAYLPYNGSITNFENIVLSDTEFKKTFWLDFPVESSPIDLTKQKIDIIFPNVEIQAEISVCLQADLFVSGSITKEYSISKSPFLLGFLSNIARNGIVTSNHVLNDFAIGNMDTIGKGLGNMYFTISNKMANSSKRVKVEVHYKAREKKYRPSGESLVKYIFDNLTTGNLYLSSFTLPVNNETKPALPFTFKSFGFNSMMIDTTTKEVKETYPYASVVRISKEIDFQGDFNNYIGSKAGDYLDTPDTTAKLFSQIVPSNYLVHFINNGLLRIIKIFSSDINIEIKLYLLSISQTITGTGTGFNTTILNPRLIVDSTIGRVLYSFAVDPNRFVTGGEILMLAVKSKIATPRKVVLEGAVTFLTV